MSSRNIRFEVVAPHIALAPLARPECLNGPNGPMLDELSEGVEGIDSAPVVHLCGSLRRRPAFGVQSRVDDPGRNVHTYVTLEVLATIQGEAPEKTIELRFLEVGEGDRSLLRNSRASLPDFSLAV